MIDGEHHADREGCDIGDHHQALATALAETPIGKREQQMQRDRSDERPGDRRYGPTSLVRIRPSRMRTIRSRRQPRRPRRG
jgi:hypothetical protein